MAKDPLVPVYGADGDPIYVPSSTAQAHGSSPEGGLVSNTQLENIAEDRANQLEQAFADAKAAAAEVDGKK